MPCPDGRASGATSAGRVVLAPEGRRMLRLEARNSQVPIERKPPWIKTRLRTGPSYTELKALVRSEGLHTVCEEAGCPNIFECWEDREATFLIGGDQCTRRCDFCQIATGRAGSPGPAHGRPRRPRRWRRVAVRADVRRDSPGRARLRRGAADPRLQCRDRAARRRLRR